MNDDKFLICPRCKKTTYELMIENKEPCQKLRVVSHEQFYRLMNNLTLKDVLLMRRHEIDSQRIGQSVKYYLRNRRAYEKYYPIWAIKDK